MKKDNNNDKNLHDQLDDHFSDPQRKKLIEALDAVMERNETSKKNSYERFRLLYIPLAAAFILFIIYIVFQLNPSENKITESSMVVSTDSSSQVKPEHPDQLVQEDFLEGKQEHSEKTTQKRITKKTKKDPEPEPEYYVMIDRERFQPNAQLEALTQSTFRGETLELSFDKPFLKNYSVTPQNNNISILLKGSISGTQENIPFSLLVFDNSNVNNPVFQIPVEVEMDSINAPHFTIEEQLSLDYGLYYYIFETKEGDLINGGQFTVELKQ